MILNRSCLVCNKEFSFNSSDLKFKKRIYCSKKCASIVNSKNFIGKKFPSIPHPWKIGKVPKSAFQKGDIPWNSGLAIWETFKCLNCNKEFKSKISPSRIGRNKYCSTSCSNKYSNWKGGVTRKNELLRNKLRQTIEYEEWRKKVLEKDNYLCQNCFEVKDRLNADHIIPWNIAPDLRFDIDNGQCLCFECHHIKTKEDWKKYGSLRERKIDHG